MNFPTTFPQRPAMRSKWAALAAAPLLAVATPAQAQGITDGWQFEASIYGWFPAISGTTSFPPNGGGPSIDVSTGDVIDALKFAFMGTFQARNGQWGLWTDLVYADFGASRQGSRDFSIGGHPLPAGLNADLTLDIKTWVWTLAGLYALKSDGEGTMDLLFGTRMLDMTNTLDWSLNGTGPRRAATAEWHEGSRPDELGCRGGTEGPGLPGASAAGSCPTTSTWGRENPSSPGRPMPAWATTSTGAHWSRFSALPELRLQEWRTHRQRELQRPVGRRGVQVLGLK